MTSFLRKRGERLLCLSFALIFFASFSCIAESEDNLFGYDWTKVHVQGVGGILTYNSKSSYSLDEFKANLSFYPKNYDNQILSNEKFSSSPDAEIISHDNSVLYIWDNPGIGSLMFDFESDVLVNLNIVKIKEKIYFPPIIESVGLQSYLSSTELINSDDLQIKKASSVVVEGVDDYYMAVHKIAFWIDENVEYLAGESTLETSKDSRWVFDNRIGVCDEITNLFIAMLRSVGIPAKFVAGFAYSNQINDFGSHAWAEVYFPGYGWVPFDVTYGQYGFVDSTHVKFRETIDGSLPSVDYVWKGRNVESEVEGVEYNVSFLEHGGDVERDFELEIDVLKDNIGEGSYVPFMVLVKNNEDNYLSVSLHITKAPVNLEENSFNILVPPLEEKKVFRIMQIPDDLKNGYVYSSFLEITDLFESKLSSDNLEYGKSFNIYSKEDAESMIENLKEEESYSYSSDVEVECSFNKNVYYVSEIVDVKCEIFNKGNTNLENLEVCFDEDCEIIDLLIFESKELSFNQVLSSNDVFLDINSDELVKHVYFDIEVYKQPNFEFNNVEIPNEIDYHGNENITFNVNVDSPVSDVVISLSGRSLFHIDSLSGVNDFLIPISGSFFKQDLEVLKAVYKDINGEKHEVLMNFEILVVGVPFYVRYFGFILFGCVVVVLVVLFLVRKYMFKKIVADAPHKKHFKKRRRRNV